MSKFLHIHTDSIIKSISNSYEDTTSLKKDKLIKGLTKRKIEIPTRPNAVYHSSGDQKSQKVSTGTGTTYIVKEKSTERDK